MRIALGIEYDGTEFSGWQRLTHGETDVDEQRLGHLGDPPIVRRF